MTQKQRNSKKVKTLSPQSAEKKKKKKSQQDQNINKSGNVETVDSGDNEVSATTAIEIDEGSGAKILRKRYQLKRSKVSSA